MPLYYLVVEDQHNPGLVEPLWFPHDKMACDHLIEIASRLAGMGTLTTTSILSDDGREIASVIGGSVNL